MNNSNLVIKVIFHRGKKQFQGNERKCNFTTYSPSPKLSLTFADVITSDHRDIYISMLQT